MTVCLACSPGGHLPELQAVQGAFAPYRRVWVTGPSRQAEVLREAGEDVWLLPSWGRDDPGMRGFVPNVRAARRVVSRYRPRVVVTNGAGLVVPLALMARAAGAELVVIETMARVTDWSLTGRILAPLARTVVVQWPEMRRGRGREIVTRPALLEAGSRARPGRGTGTFVSVGTRPEPFDRLLAMVDRAVAAGVLPGPVLAQAGTSSYRPRAYSATAWKSPAEIDQAIHGARYVVCHGGSGLIAAAIAAGRRPLVLARRRALGEHRTEHQQQIVDKLAEEGAVVALRWEIGRHEVELADERPRDPSRHSELPSLEAVLRDRLPALLRES